MDKIILSFDRDPAANSTIHVRLENSTGGFLYYENKTLKSSLPANTNYEFNLDVDQPVAEIYNIVITIQGPSSGT